MNLNNDMTSISIVIPVYNAEDSIGKLVDELVLELNDYHDVTVIDKHAPGKPVEGVRYIKERIGSSTCNDVMLFNYLEGADVVYHLAAEPRVQATMYNPSRAFNDNCLATQQVLEAVRHLECPRLVFSSTSSPVIVPLPAAAFVLLTRRLRANVRRNYRSGFPTSRKSG